MDNSLFPGVYADSLDKANKNLKILLGNLTTNDIIFTYIHIKYVALRLLCTCNIRGNNI